VTFCSSSDFIEQLCDIPFSTLQHVAQPNASLPQAIDAFCCQLQQPSAVIIDLVIPSMMQAEVGYFII